MARNLERSNVEPRTLNGKAPARTRLGNSKFSGSTVQGSKFSAVPGKFPHVLIKRLARVQSLRDWWFKEAREGGYLERYIRQEKHQMPERVRAVARTFVDWKQPTKTDFQLRAAIPARLFHRLKAEDPHFFDDNTNLRKLKSDNPELTIKL